ncbi:MAG: hypothetical protein JSV60_02265 [Desulfobacterales bacterium]|nr:MAG: hypothetical protein JSV60_02265 [Desulfobacterales bacterium]
MERVFSVRKKAYDDWVRSENDMPVYRKKMDLLEKGSRLCRFLSFLDDRNSTVGCLLHPGRLENKGVDFRDYGFYEDCGFCASNFCASSHNLLKRDTIDKQFFLLVQEGMDWYEYSRLFSFYVDVNGTKGLFDTYVKYTRPLYKVILQRLSRTDLKGKGFAEQYQRLIRTIANRIKPSPSRVTKADDLPFQDMMEILGNRQHANAVYEELDKFIKVLGE